MSADKEIATMQGTAQNYAKTQEEIDEEIAEIEQRSRHHHSEIAHPPQTVPLPLQKALTMVGVILLTLLTAGSVSMVSRFSHARVMARESAQNAVLTVAVVHPTAEKPNVDLMSI
jgi:hypothetical protein